MAINLFFLNKGNSKGAGKSNCANKITSKSNCANKIASKGASKGAIFTVMATIMVTLLLWGVSGINKNVQDTWEPELVRVKVINGLTDSFLSYANNALRVSVRNGLNDMSTAYYSYNDPSMTEYFSNETTFLNNLTSCILGVAPYNNITFENQEFACNNNLSLVTLLDSFVNIIYQNLNVNITYKIYDDSFYINQTSFFQADIGFKINVSVIDVFVNWSITNKTINSKLSFIGLKDPVIEKFRGNRTYTSIRYPESSINPTTIRNSQWDVNSTLSFLANQEYRPHTLAPNYLMRFYGNFSPDSYGIETLINSSWIVSGGFGNLNNLSFVDYELFASTDSDDFIPQKFNCSGNEHVTYGVDADGYPSSFRMNSEYIYSGDSNIYSYNITPEYWDTTC